MIDLRSDTVTRPSAAMREAMARAEVGDDVYGEDPAARRLEECAAAMLGKERAVFFPSGTQSNLAAALAHCGRGDEYLVGDCYHIYRCEAGGAAALGGISPFPLKTGEDGGLTAEQIAAAVKEDDSHFPRTALLCLENTVSGAAQDEKNMQAAVAAARERGLRAHLDGARLFNAAVEQDIAARQLAAPFDSVSVCLSKGLGAPAGTMLCGEEAFCETARRLRKLLGGGMRQVGILAAAGLWALQNNIVRLRDDHRHAEALAGGLAAIDGVDGAAVSQRTNMIYFRPAPEDREPLRRHLAKRDIQIGEAGGAYRLVTHLDIAPDDIAAVVSAAADYYSRR